MCREISLPAGGSSENVGTEMVTSYPTPIVSTITWFGCCAISFPRRWAIISDILAVLVSTQQSAKSGGRLAMLISGRSLFSRFLPVKLLQHVECLLALAPIRDESLAIVVVLDPR